MTIPLQPLNLTVLTVSDSRTPETDSSGDYLAQAAQTSGHQIVDRAICIDNIYLIRARISLWIADPDIHGILITGGTGFSGRDSTPEAVTPLFDKRIDGFGELFRYQSFKEIGTSTIQSRAIAGLSNQTLLFCLPGSTGACRTGWAIIQHQLDSRHKPCNFVGTLTGRNAHAPH